MAQQQAAAQVAKLLSRVGRWAVVLGVGGSAVQASLYTGRLFSLLKSCAHACVETSTIHCTARLQRHPPLALW